MKQHVIYVFLSLILLTGADASSDSVHSLITPYKEASNVKSTKTKYANYSLIVGFDFETKKPKGVSVTGTLTRMYHDNPKARSILEVFDNYKESLLKAGMVALWQCHGDGECFTSSTRNSYKAHNGIQAINGGDSRYLAGKLVIENITYHIALAVGRKGTSIDIVESSTMDRNMVKINKDLLLDSLKAYGAVKVDGLYFAHDKSELLPESSDSMNVLAELLRDNPKLKLFVVGHTDLTGKVEYNLNLSKLRAESVIKRLVNNHKIARDRLKAYGVGPLAPKFSNENEAGRASNRRVEVVVMSW